MRNLRIDTILFAALLTAVAGWFALAVADERGFQRGTLDSPSRCQISSVGTA
jgi:hypothetical protein